MKNFKYILTIIVMLFSLNSVKAQKLSYTDYYNCATNSKCILMCEYKYTENFTDNISGSTTFENVSIKIYYNNGLIEIYGNPSTDGTRYTGYYTDSKKVIMDSQARENLVKNGICPSFSYYNFGNIDSVFKTTYKFCFDNSSYCLGVANSYFKGDSSILYTKQKDIDDWIINYKNKYTNDCGEYDNYTIETYKNSVLPIQNYKTEFGTLAYHTMANDIFGSFKYEDIPTLYQRYFNNKFPIALKKIASNISSCQEKFLSEAKNNIDESDYNKLVNEINEANVVNEINEIADSANSKPIIGDIPNLDADGKGCDNLFGKRDENGKPVDGTPLYYFEFAFKIIKYIAIIILIVLSILDFISAVASQDDDALKKTFKKFMKRLVYCVIIFILPILLDYFLQLLEVSNSGTCGIR